MTNGATTPGTCREVGVPMRDGVVLHADLYLPAGDDPHPVLVHRTAYGTRVLPELAGPDDVVVSHHQLRHGVAHPSRLVLRTLSR